MRRNHGKRGQMRVIEVIIALFIIVAALGFANLLSVPPMNSKYDATELQKLGYNVLLDLDKQSLLPSFVYNEDWQNLTSALRVTLPINVYFNLTVYSIRETTVGDAITNEYVAVNQGPNGAVSYGDSTTFSTAKEVVSVTYGLVGYPSSISQTEYNAEYSARIIVLELTRG